MFDLINYGPKPCLEGEGHVFSYLDVHGMVDSMRPVFDGRGLVLCLCENSVSALVGYIAFMVHGQVPILLDAGQQRAALQRIVDEYRPEYAWLPQARSEDLPGGEVVHRIGHHVLLRLPEGDAPRTPLHADLQLLLSTSGSTGSSKFVRLTRKNLEANAASIIAYLGIRSEDVAVTTLPFSYSFGLSIINTHLLAGASIQVTGLTPLGREFWDLVEYKRVSSLSGVPYTYEMLRRIKFDRFELPGIRYLTQAGGKMSEQGLAYLARVAAAKAWPCFVMYGQTEATARMAYLPAAWLERKSGSIGQAIPNGRFEIVSEDGEVLAAPGARGELVYYGPNVAMGYATARADLVRGDEWHGRLPTGDVAYRDEDGCYYLVGRLKRFVKLFGNRVSLDEVETLLHTAFGQAEFICFGQDDGLHIACVGEIEANVVVDFVSRQLSIHRSAIKCTFLEEIPRLSNGKVNYNALVQ